MQPKYLLDADTIVHSYELNVWEEIIDRTEVFVTASVKTQEALFYSKEYQNFLIDLPRLVETGEIFQIDPPASEISQTVQKFDDLFVKGLHQGEIEALAYLKGNEEAGIRFSTGDKKALQAAAMLDIAYLVVSLEEILSSIGFQKPIDHQFTKSYCDRYLDKGHQNKILGRGLSGK